MGTLVNFILLVFFLTVDAYLLWLWHRVWFGSGSGAMGRLLSGFFCKQADSEETALKAVDAFLRIFISVFMLVILIVSFVLVHIMTVW